MIESLPNADTVLVIWFKLLVLAGKSNNNGVFMMSNRIPYTDEMLAAIFHRDKKIVQYALKTFEGFEMIEIIDDVITIPKWDKHQSLDSYEKKKERDRKLQAERRAKQKALIEKSSDNRLTDCDSSSDIVFTEGEGEKEKEKEIHSFTLSDEEREEEMSRRRRILGSVEKGLVMLSDAQMEDLLDRLTLEEFDKYFDIVAECERKGKSFKKKTHYQAILDMAEKDRAVHRRKNG